MPQLERFVQVEKIDDFSLPREPQHEYQAELDQEWILKGLIKPKSLEELETTIPRILSEETKRAVIKVMKDMTNKIKMGKAVAYEPIREISKRLTEEIMAHRKAMLNLIKMRSFENYTFTHSINVCLISILVGLEMGFTKPELEGLARGALFHDIGRLKLPKELLSRPGPLAPGEFDEIKKHPVLGWEMMSDDERTSEVSRAIILQHHERHNGEGYPYGLKGEGIHLSAIICSLADVYDALTSKRPYRNALTPYEAMKYIVIASANTFRADVAGCLLRSLSIYPLGSLIKLNTGEIGRVIRANRNAVIRPVIRLLLDYEGESFTDLIEIDLTQQPHRYIVEAVDEEALRAKK